MYEYHGWITVRETPENKDEERIEEIVSELREQIGRQNWEPGALELRAANGTYQIMAAGNHNRRPVEEYDPVRFFRYVGEKAPGSYGLLYVWDDEDPQFFNQFRVYVLARGTVAEREDPFLSPCVPVIEDEDGDEER
jgi:hypothetical protein